MSTIMAKAQTVDRKWYVIDAEGKVLGRLASEVAAILRGKKKAEFTPFTDCGDYVIVVNAAKVLVTGKKEEKKIYRHHSGWFSGMKEVPYAEMMARHPERIIEMAVRGMLPHNSMGRQMFRKLKVYAGPEHEQQAQQPEVYEF